MPPIGSCVFARGIVWVERCRLVQLFYMILMSVMMISRNVAVEQAKSRAREDQK